MPWPRLSDFIDATSFCTPVPVHPVSATAMEDEREAHFVHVLRDLPLPAARPIIAAYVSHLDARGAEAVGALAGHRHVSFALEVTGACLTLPLEDVELMNMSVNMLTRWYAGQ